MKKKPHERARNLINKHIDGFIKKMNLQDWEIDVEYMKGKYENELTGMTIEYLRSTIRLFDRVYELPDNEIIDMFTHELAHIITEPLYSLARANANPHLHPFIEEQREQMTERIARIVRKI